LGCGCPTEVEDETFGIRAPVGDGDNDFLAVGNILDTESGAKRKLAMGAG